MIQLLPQGKTCQVRCLFQTVILDSEPQCIVMGRMQGLVTWKNSLTSVLGCDKSYLSKWLGLSLLEGSDQMGGSQTVSKLDEGRWDTTGLSSDRPEAEWVNSHVKVKPCCRNSSLQLASRSICNLKFMSSNTTLFF